MFAFNWPLLKSNDKYALLNSFHALLMNSDQILNSYEQC